MSNAATFFSSKPSLRSLFQRFNSSNLFFRIFCFLAIALFGVMAQLSKDYGVTWDEWIVSNGGIVSLRYLLTGGENKEALDFLGIGMYYGQFFYSLVIFVYGMLAGSFKEFVLNGFNVDSDLVLFFRTSHLMNALFGWVGMIYTARLIRDMTSWRGACIGLCLIALSPRFFGHSMNNSKDIPFAAAYVVAIFYMAKYMRQLPDIKFPTILGLTAGIAAALGVRVGGILLLCYFVLFTGCAWYLRRHQDPEAWKKPRWWVYSLTIILVAYFLGLVFWPYGLHRPWINPFIALREMSNYVAWSGLVLFDGAQIPSTQLPWYYLLKWLLISSPFTILIGLLLFALSAKSIFKVVHRFTLVMVLFAAIFPVAYILIKKSVVYDGLRHILFVYPLLVVIAAVAWEHLIKIAKTHSQKVLAAVILFALLAEPFHWMIRSHPNQYVYFNPFVGGINGAVGRYETDYFGNCIKQASEWLGHYHQSRYGAKPVMVRADGNVMSSYPYLKRKWKQNYKPYGYPEDFVESNPFYHLNYGPYRLAAQGWDYAVLLPRGWTPVEMEKGWPPLNSIYRVRVDDVVLCAVVPNEKRIA